MPIKSFPISKFGGLNTEVSERDLKPGQLTQADDIMVEKVGRITLGGSMVDDTTAITRAISNGVTGGYGLFQFSSDYDFTTTPEQNRTNYLVIQDGKDFVIVQDYDSTPASHATDSNGDSLIIGTNDTNVKPCYYYVNGALRICDGNFDNTGNKRKFLGYIHRTHFESVLCEDNYNNWLLLDANITKPSDGDIVSDISTTFPSAGKGVNIEITPTGIPEGNFSAGTYEFAISFLYDESQESELYVLSETVTLTDGTHSSMRVSGVSATYPFNPRISNTRVYTKIAKSDDPWIYLLDIDMTKGIRTIDGILRMIWNSTYATNPNEVWTETATIWPTFSITELPSTSYSMNTGRDYNTVVNAKYKTACIANRKCYIGNIEQDGKVYGDRMLKSNLNQFDIFPEDNYIDVVVDDGDDIIKLIPFADRILQFKRKNMYVINISQDYEFLEDTHLNKGISGPYQATAMENGAVWCNTLGVYYYDGEKVHDLSKSITEDYQSFVSTVGAEFSIGYDSIHKKLFVLKSNSRAADDGDSTDDNHDGDAYVFNFNNMSWTRLNDLCLSLTLGTSRTNFEQGVNGELLIFEEGDNKVYTYSNTPVQQTGLTIKTSDLDLGNIALKKRLHSIKLTYKVSGVPNVSVGYYKDGASSLTSFSTSLTTTDGEWDVTEIVPTAKFDFYSLKLCFSSTGTVPASLEINDISIVYREKGNR